MVGKLILLLTVTHLLLTNQVESTFKLAGRKLACWHIPILYTNFQVDLILSTRNVKNRLLKNNDVFGPGGVDFDPSRKTAVIVHGLSSNAYTDDVQNMAKELLAMEDMNVILVDWNKGSYNFVIYPLAAVNTERTAMMIRQFFSQQIKKWANTEKSVENWGPLHFIGFSLGAHAAGQAAELLKVKDNLIVDRVTGLDPAEPCFDESAKALKLNSTNARFVDVIHTDGAPTKNTRFGLLEPLGHADFYINGGVSQPGCNPVVATRTVNIFLDKLLYHTVSENGMCHHSRAGKLFVDSITQKRLNKCTFWAHPWRLGSSSAQVEEILKSQCNSGNCVEMGINAELYQYSKNSNNEYYVKTGGKTPFCEV